MDFNPNDYHFEDLKGIRGRNVFLTGGDLFVGGNVARILSACGARVKALRTNAFYAEKTPKYRGLDGLDVEIIEADLNGYESYLSAVKQCDFLLHCEEDYRTWAADNKEITKTNVLGTKAVLKAAQSAGIKKFIYMSRIGALGRGAGVIADEKTPVDMSQLKGVYQKSKYRAERLVMKFIDNGLNAIIVNPAACIGEGDFQPTPIGKLLIRFASGKLPGYIEAGRNMADVRDVAKGIISAALFGKFGERYILGGHNITIEEFLGEISDVTGIKMTQWKFPWVFAYMTALVNEMRSKVSGKPPKLSVEAALASRQKLFFSASKAKKDLKWEAGPLKPAIERALDWFVEYNYLKPLDKTI